MGRQYWQKEGMSTLHQTSNANISRVRNTRVQFDEESSEGARVNRLAGTNRDSPFGEWASLPALPVSLTAGGRSSML